MNETQTIRYITDTFAGVKVVDAWGDMFFYYNPSDTLPDEFYFASLKSQDDDYDKFSNLNRPSTFRLNIGVGKESYRALFGGPPARPDAEGNVESNYDFTVLDQLLPHPIYGRQYWVCVINPSAETFEKVKPLLAEAFQLAVDKYEKRAARATSE
jgi:hypothetical protein